MERWRGSYWRITCTFMKKNYCNYVTYHLSLIIAQFLSLTLVITWFGSLTFPDFCFVFSDNAWDRDTFISPFVMVKFHHILIAAYVEYIWKLQYGCLYCWLQDNKLLFVLEINIFFLVLIITLRITWPRCSRVVITYSSWHDYKVLNDRIKGDCSIESWNCIVSQFRVMLLSYSIGKWWTFAFPPDFTSIRLIHILICLNSDWSFLHER